ncbi:MAG TPA: divergent polysaccharide deacetylase family protein, partial [Rhodospirillales bacterium]
DLVIDEDPSRLAIEAKLNQLEELVRQRQVAVAVAHPYPATVERLINWTTTLKFKKITLVPVSALANKQKAE